MLPYTDLPHLMPQKLLAQHFRAPVDADGLVRMAECSNYYSKVREPRTWAVSTHLHAKRIKYTLTTKQFTSNVTPVCAAPVSLTPALALRVHSLQIGPRGDGQGGRVQVG